MKKGFTLIELLVVITVISILTTMVLFGLNKSQQAARDASRQQIMSSLQTALERYYSDNQAYAYPGGSSGISGILWAMCTHVSYTPGGPCELNPSYLPSVPKDPSPSCTNATGGAGGTPWYPCPSKTTPAYFYENPDGTHCTGKALPNGYQLRLVMESGGTSYYCSP